MWSYNEGGRGMLSVRGLGVLVVGVLALSAVAGCNALGSGVEQTTNTGNADKPASAEHTNGTGKLNTSEPAAEPDTSDDHATSGAGGFVIPVETRASQTLDLILMPADDAQDVELFQQRLDFALGPEYPAHFIVDLGMLAASIDGFSGLAKEELSILSVESTDVSGLTASATDELAFELGLLRAGEYHVTSQLRWRPKPDWSLPGVTAGQERNLQLDLLVHVRVAASAALLSPPECTRPDGASYLFSGSNFSGRIQLQDGEGQPFSPANASRSRPLTVELSATSGTTFTSQTELGDLLSFSVIGEPQRITISSALGDLGSWQLITPSQVDRLEVQYIAQQGSKAQQLLVSGSEQSLFEWPSTRLATISVLPSLWVDQTKICTSYSSDLFELTSTTPDTCPLWTQSPSAACVADCEPELAAELRSPGRCALTLTAPTLSNGNGLTHSYDGVLEYTISN